MQGWVIDPLFFIFLFFYWFFYIRKREFGLMAVEGGIPN